MKTMFGILAGFFLLSVTESSAQPDTLWTRCFGGVGDEIAASLLAAESGGLVAVGSSNTETGRWQVYVIRADDQGDAIWSHQIGYVNSGNRWGIGVLEHHISSWHFTVISQDYSGSLTSFTRLFYSEGGFSDYLDPPTGSYRPTAIAKTSDYRIIVGRIHIGGQEFNTNGFTFRYALIGEWEPQSYHLTGGFLGFMDVTPSADQWMVGGYRGFWGENSDFLLMKLTSDGNALWSRFYGGMGADTVTSVVQTIDGGFAFTGPTESFGENGDFCLMRVDLNGDSLWTQTYGGPGVDRARKVLTTPDGGFLLTGYTESVGTGGDIWIVRTDSLGNELWSQNYGGEGFDSGMDAVALNDSEYVILGTTASFGAGGTDIYLLRLAPSQTAISAPAPVASAFELQENYPNPFNSATRISFSLPVPTSVSLRVYDVLGREVATPLKDHLMSAGLHQVAFDAAALASGIYLFRMEAAGQIQTRKMVVLK